LTALLAAALLLAAPAPAGPPTVTGVVLKLPPGEDAAALEGLVAARAGQPLSARALRRTVTLLYQLGRFSDVVVRAVPAGEGQVVLVVECLKKRVVRSLEIRQGGGPAVLEAEQLQKLLGLGSGDEFWQGRLDQGLARARNDPSQGANQRNIEKPIEQTRPIPQNSATQVRQAESAPTA